MLGLPGYQIVERVGVGGRCVVYRAYATRERRWAIIKALRAEAPTGEAIARLRHEHAVLQGIDHPGVVRSYGLLPHERGLVLLQEDCGGRSLREILAAQRLPLDDCLRLALALARTLDDLHGMPLLHRRVEPSNVIVNLDSGQVKLTNFSAASRLPVEHPARSMAGASLAYAPPELVGHTLRTVDRRSDLYALGVILYEMLTGQLPFATQDPVALARCHLGARPVPPARMSPAVPEPVSRIVTKLLAKAAEDRYQSAAGLEADLETCLAQLEAGGPIAELVPDRGDPARVLSAPHTLFGREAELATMMSTFERASVGSTELLLVSGAAGVGKTSVVHAMYEPVIARQGYFVTGRFEQRKRNTPYYGLIQAFRSLLRQVLVEGAHRLSQVRDGLMAAITPNGRVLGELIPEVAAIIGEQPPVPALPPIHRQNRLGRAIQQLARVLARPEHPLVLVLDGMQWADTASLRLIEGLVMDPNRMHLLIVGAYRDEEVDAIHPLATAVSNMREEGVDVHRISVPPLPRAAAAQLVLAMLAGSRAIARTVLDADTGALVERLTASAAGNPRLLIHLVQSLHEEGLLRCDPGEGLWRCAAAEDIQAAGVLGRPLVELTAERIQALPEATRRVLQRAACIGDPLELDVMAAVCGQPVATIAAALQPALDAGLVFPLSEPWELSFLLDDAAAPEAGSAAHRDIRPCYRFAHESARRAAYATIPEAERDPLHLEIGRTLLRQSSRQERGDEIFLIVDQLDQGRELLSAESDKEELAELNLDAVRRAREAGVNEAALRYIAVGMNLLDGGQWLNRYELSMAFHMEALAAEQAAANFERLDKLAELALRHARTEVEQAEIHAFQVEALVARNQMQAAIEVALHALQVLHIPLSVEPPADLVPADLDALPALASQETEKAIAHRILAVAAEALYVLGPEIVEPVLATRLHLCREGASPRILADAAMDRAIWLCSAAGGIERGHALGRLVLSMLDRFDLGELRCSMLQKFYVHVGHWMTHVKESISPLRSAIQAGLDLGAPRSAGNAAFGYCSHLFFLGENLEFVDGQCARYSELVGRLGLSHHASAFDLIRQMMWSLLGRSRETVRLMGDLFDEAAELPHLRDNNSVALLFVAYFEKLLLAYLFGDATEAVEHAREAARYVAGVTGTLWVSEHNFFYSLALLAACREADASQRQALLGQVSANQQRLQRWVEHAPFNFDYKHDLVEAEMARVLGAHEEAMELYDRAIRNAHEQGVVHIKALACELAAEQCASLGEDARAHEYVHEAHFQYVRWGAWAKVKDLESRYPRAGLRKHADAAQARRDAEGEALANRRPPVLLDFEAVLHASQAISGEIELGAVLRRAIELIVARTGARRGALALVHDPGDGGARALVHDDDLFIDAAYAVGEPGAQVLQATPVGPAADAAASPAFSPEIILHVARTHELLVLADAHQDPRFGSTAYVTRRKPRSILCAPLRRGEALVGVLYLEEGDEIDAFTPGRVEIARLLGRQTAISIINARVIDDRLVAARTHVEEERQQMNAALEREAWELARLNVDKDKFFSIISHDLRNPFNMMLNLVELAVDEADELSPVEMKDTLVKLQQAAESCYNLLENLLTWSRLQSGRMAYKPVSEELRPLAQGTVSLLQRTAEEKGIELYNRVDKGVRINADKHMIDMVIRNLIGNALKFTPKGGSVEISARFAGKPEGEEAPELIEVAVRDTGMGIPEDDLGKLFRNDVHYTRKGTANERGTGLGLTMCMEMVKQNGGDIRVESKVGEGTTFLFTVPAMVESAEEAAKGSQAKGGKEDGEKKAGAKKSGGNEPSDGKPGPTDRA